MNEIESEYDGVVEAVLVNNEDVVEYGPAAVPHPIGGYIMRLGIKEIQEIIPAQTSVSADRFYR